MIWCVEDDASIRDIEVYALRSTGFEAEGFEDGTSFWEALRTQRPELVVLDVMLPDIDGFSLCRKIRESRFFPILMLTARVADSDKILGLTIGADDYITKPFSFKEMVCRVNAQIRRYYDLNRPAANADRHFGALMISSERFEAKVNGEPLNLTAKEFKILDFLTLNQNQIFSKQKLIDAVWGIDEYIDENTRPILQRSNLI